MLCCMAYEVTATRRRPKTFDELVGQEFVAATLKNAVDSGKIAHAYLFAGPRGCGKTSSARILAKALNCEHGPCSVPCGECSPCKEISRGSSLDVIEIDGASNTSVNDIRQIKDEVLFPPNSCRYKIYIIDEVHMLSTSAFNALLKTIEEPPPYVIFIFATTELHKVPATIKSRCQQFHFRLVSVEQIKTLLTEAAAEINVQADDEALYWIARESTGSIRDAYTLFDQVASFSGNHITYEKIRDTLGLVGIDVLNALCETCVQGNAAAALEQLDAILQGGVSIEQFISNLTDYLRSLLLINTGITKEALLGQSAERYSPAVKSAWNLSQLERAVSLMMNLFRDIRYSLSPRYETEIAVARLCGISSYVSNQEIKDAVEQARQLLTGGTSAGSGVNAGAGGVSGNKSGGLPDSLAGMNPQVPRFAVFQQETPDTPLADGGAVPPDHRQSLSVPAGNDSSFFAAGYSRNNSGFGSTVSAGAAGSGKGTVAGSPVSAGYDDAGVSPGNQFFAAGMDGNASRPVPHKGEPAASSVTGFSGKNLYTGTQNAAVFAGQGRFDARLESGMATESAAPVTDNAAGRAGSGKIPASFLQQDSAAKQPEGVADVQGGTKNSFSCIDTSVTAHIPVPLENLRKELIAELTFKHTLTASALMDSLPWDFSTEGLVKVPVTAAFTFSQLQKEKQLLTEYLSVLSGRRLVFEPELQSPEQKRKEPEFPEQVNILCKLFKGSVTGVQ